MVISRSITAIFAESKGKEEIFKKPKTKGNSKAEKKWK